MRSQHTLPPSRYILTEHHFDFTLSPDVRIWGHAKASKLFLWKNISYFQILLTLEIQSNLTRVVGSHTKLHLI